MNPVVRGIVIYFFILLIFRIMGKRALSETTTFDFVLLLIISEVTQQGLVGEDFSITGAALLIITLMGLDQLIALIKQKIKGLEKVIDGAPLVIVDNGQPLKGRMSKSKVDEDDILQAARTNNGLEKMEDIKYAVLERDGTISIIPFSNK